ncbi:MAG: NEL-type E3 ubiquitin ligase domain-containing protein, partial [Candidatus Rhabdochlamydia sp.]
GSLNLLLCKNVKELPEGLVVEKDLNLADCGITALPSGLKVKGGLTLAYCDKLRELPEIFIVEGNLHIFQCEALIALPKELKIQGSFDLMGHEGLTHLPEIFTVGKNLNLSHCKALIALPKGLEIQGNLELSGCKRLMDLPENLTVENNLNCSGCTAITTLPKGLKVKGNLDFSYCEGLIALPQQLKVKESLDSIETPFLEFGGDLDLTGCISLTSLPNWIATLSSPLNRNERIINLTESGLSPTVIRRLVAESASNLGIQIHFSEVATEPLIIEFNDLFEALEFWQQYIQEDRRVNIKGICNKLHRTLTQVQDHQNLLSFLTRLTETADYCNLATRESVARQVLHMIWLMAEDEVLCHHIAFFIHQGLSSCDDRIMATLSDMGFYQKLRALQHDSVTSEEVRSLGRGFFLLEELNKRIRARVQTLHFMDEVEVFMAFHIRLQAMLNLPIDMHKMLFRKCVAISDEEMDQMGRKILQEIVEDAFEAFLKEWEPWKEHQRRSSIVTWEKLTPISYPLLPIDICPYLQDAPDHPVLYQNVIYDYTAFIKRYIQEGVDLYGATVNIEKLLRITVCLIP